MVNWLCSKFIFCHEEQRQKGAQIFLNEPLFLSVFVAKKNQVNAG